MAIKRSPHHRQLIAHLKHHGDWMSRDELARAMGKSMFSLEDMMQLDLLEEAGLLTKEVVDYYSSSGKAVRYRYSGRKRK